MKILPPRLPMLLFLAGTCLAVPLLSCSSPPPETMAEIQQKAEAGDAYAQFAMGYRCYVRDPALGVQKNDADAVSWWRKAAEQGYAAAQFDLGLMYHMGRGVQKDDVEAVKWVQKAADQQYIKAEYILGLFHQNGTGGLQQDYEDGQVWFKKAAEQEYDNQQYYEDFMTPYSPDMRQGAFVAPKKSRWLF